MRRSTWVTAAVSEGEKARIVAAAAKTRLTVSAWIRYTLMDAVAKEERPGER